MRHVALEGPANFRDLGGYETLGGRRVRTGRLYRSDSLSRMTEADVRHCVDELGIRTVVDLRAGHEVEQFSHGPLPGAGVRVLHRPIIDETRAERIQRRLDMLPPELLSLDQIYLMMLDRFGDRIVEVVGLVADPDLQPLVFHCAAGKDRTGIVAALILETLGVDDETIAADYALTTEAMPELIARHRAAAGRRGIAEVEHQQLGADPAAMRAVLAELRVRFGGAEGYLLERGLGENKLRSLRASLLE